MARPTKINKEILAKLEQAFKIGANDEEACLHAGIDPATLYRYQDKNEEFCKQKKMWKRNPILKARHTIYKNLDDPSVAKWLLERRDKDFSTKVEQTVSGGLELTPLTFEILPVKAKDEI
jgi:hypothetical protein